MDQNRDDGMILGATDVPAGADGLLDALSESTSSPAAVEKTDSRRVGAQTAYQLLDARALLAAMSTSDDAKDRRRAYDIGADLLQDRTARESGHVMVLTGAAIRFLTEAIEGDNVDNRVKALMHANASLKHWASVGTPGVSVLDVAPLLSLINRTVARASYSQDPEERLGVLSIVGSLTMLDRDAVSAWFGQALRDTPTQELNAATTAAAVRTLYSGAVAYRDIEARVLDIIDNYPAPLAEQCVGSFHYLDDPRKNITMLPSDGWYELARRWWRREKRADSLGEYQSAGGHVFIGIKWGVDHLPSEVRKAAKTARKAAFQ